MDFGTGTYTSELAEDWARLPDGWRFGWVPGVAVDSKDRVFVYSRSEHPLVLFDKEGSFLESWGEGLLLDAHGIFIDTDDNVFCVERDTHCLRKFTSAGELVMTIGTPGEAAETGEPFRRPTDVGIDSTGCLYITDGYDNTRVHKYSPDGERMKSWGEPGTGPGQFDLPHCARVDKQDRVWIADRSNNRIQRFDTDGIFLDEWPGLHQPDTIHIDENEIVYIAELDQRVSIWTLEGEKLSEWGGGERVETPGLFRGCPHGIWTDSVGDLYVSEVQTDDRIQKFVRRS